jgi:hypothetical protein
MTAKNPHYFSPLTYVCACTRHNIVIYVLYTTNHVLSQNVVTFDDILKYNELCR